MWLRKILLAAAVVAPLAWSSTPVSAQEDGLEQAATATAQASDVAGWNHKKTPNPEKDLPAGFADYEAGQALPPGLDWSRNVAEADAEPEVQQDTEPEPEVPPEECSTTLVFIDFQPYLQDCNGNLFAL
jgi:hypothetical protein